MSTISSSLAQQLFNSSKSSSDLTSYLMKRTQIYGSTQNGKSTVLSASTLNKVTNPQTKLVLATQMAQTIKISTNAAVSTGTTTRLGDMTTQADQALSAITSAVKGLCAQDVSSGGSSSSAVLQNKGRISTALDTIHTIMSQIASLSSKTGSTTAATITKTLKQMDTTAAAVAKVAGLSWKPVTTSSSSTTTKSSSSHIDYTV